MVRHVPNLRFSSKKCVSTFSDVEKNCINKMHPTAIMITGYRTLRILPKNRMLLCSVKL